MPKRPNESPDGLQGQIDAWDRVALPCGHFVNYNTDFSLPDPSRADPSRAESSRAAGATSGAVGGAASGVDEVQWMSMNIEETMAVLTRCSFDEAHRQPIFMLGGINALAELIQVN